MKMKKKKTLWLLALCLLFAGCATRPTRPADVPRGPNTSGERGVWGEIKVMPTRPGVKQRVLIVHPFGKTKGYVVLFKGGPGTNPFTELSDGFKLSGNFLTRSAALFALQGFIAVLVEPPSDQSAGFDNIFRESRKHLKDIQVLVSHLAEQGDSPIFLIGTSRGTLSVAYLAEELKSNHVKGIVLTSSMNNISLEKTDYPVFFVHHQDDPCFMTSYSNALLSYERVSSPKQFFVTVRGGKPSRGRDCGAYSEQGFIGQESEVVKVITDWAQGKPVPKQVGP